MKLAIVAIRDTVANVYAQPQFVASIGGFVRGFGDECQREANDNQLFKHPGDFELFHLGFYDDETGKFECFDNPRSIAHGSNYRKA